MSVGVYILFKYEEWKNKAACQGENTTIFFGEEASGRGVKAKLPDYEVIEELCPTCPVRTDCYEYAVSNKERFGVWGGVDFTKRKNPGVRKKEQVSF